MAGCIQKGGVREDESSACNLKRLANQLTLVFASRFIGIVSAGSKGAKVWKQVLQSGASVVASKHVVQTKHELTLSFFNLKHGYRAQFFVTTWCMMNSCLNNCCCVGQDFDL